MKILFVGRSTLDLVYVCEYFPRENLIISSTDYYNLAGGPALNAAVTCRALGGDVELYTLLGSGAFSEAVKRELLEFKVPYRDFAEADANVLPVSSIVIVPESASRTIFDQHPDQSAPLTSAVSLSGFSRVLTDGFLPQLAIPILREARACGIPTVFDGGSWKQDSLDLVQLDDYAVVSERFRPPGTEQDDEVISFLHDCGCKHVAITKGESDVVWSSEGERGVVSIPQIDAIDTLGAGDIFHGALCYYLSVKPSFVTALEASARVASASCLHLGTRAWIKSWKN